MATWQARLLSFTLRNTLKRKLARATNALQVRKSLEHGLFPVPPFVRITLKPVAGVPGEWVEAAGKKSNLILLFLHGGGYVACNSRTHRAYTTFFAQRGFRVYSADYRLAPEHPFPAGLNDAVTVYRALRAENPDAPITMAGDSAGGGLVLAAMLRLRSEGDPLPSAAALFSPLTDLTGAGESRHLNDRRCAMFRANNLAMVGSFYAPGADWRDPLISPVFADYTGFPPMLIHVGEDETLLDDSTHLAARAKSATLKVWPAVTHDWQLFHRMVPEGRQSLEEASAFLLQNAVAVT